MFSPTNAPPEGYISAAADTNTESRSAARALIDYLNGLYFDAVLHANQLCIIMHHLTECGIQEAAIYAWPPDKQTGKYQERLDKAFNFEKLDSELYPIHLALRSQTNGERSIKTMLAQPAHEALKAEVDGQIEILDGWAERIHKEARWINAYERHHVVKAATREERKTILACALYCDGAEFSTKDSLFVFTIRFVNSRNRHLLWALRKSSLCSCGCAGWCTFSQLFQFVAWGLSSLQQGTYPRFRHDGKPLDPTRQHLAGQELGFRVVCIDILGDWKEFANTFGFPQWNSKVPCFLCDCDRLALVDANKDVHQRDDSEYDAFCRESEIYVVITNVQQHQDIRFKLFDDSTKKGLCLAKPVSSTTPKLLAGDRLEPTADFPDIHEIFLFKDPFQPFILCFWRKRTPTVVHHRNPLLSPELGISYSTFGCDVLHTKHLGTVPAWMTRAVHLIFEQDLLETRCTRQDEHMIQCAASLTARLTRWYPKYEKQLDQASRPGMTRVSKLTHKMLGTADGKKMLKLKAAEARHMLPFVIDLVKEFKEELRPKCDVDALLEAGESLERWMQTCKANGRKLSNDAARILLEQAQIHNLAAQKAGVHMLPKHHLAHTHFLFWKNT